MSNRIVFRSQRLLTVLFVTSVVFLGGCSGPEGPPKYLVSGTVTYQGKPVEDGAIVFFPTNPGGGMQDGIKIVDGKFEGKASAGPKRVYIEAKRVGPEVVDEFGDRHVSEDWYIPVKYNEQSTLTLEVLPQDNADLVYDLD